MLRKITIVGSGSWATALVKLFSDAGIQVSWLVRNNEMADYVNTHGHNPRYLPFVQLRLNYIKPFTDPVAAMLDTDIILFAVPSAYLQQTLETIPKELLENRPVAVSIKGFIPGTGQTPSRFIASYSGIKISDLIIIGGPCHAEEISCQKSTYMTIAGKDAHLVKMLCRQLNCPHLHAIPSNDPVGIEYCAILKNIIGIACGIANGLHYGDNFQSVLVSNAMRDASKFIEYTAPAKRDLFQSAYFGDLLVTAYSDLSRNRLLGKLIGKGIQVNKAIQEMQMIAEGFLASAELAPMLKEIPVHLPVLNAVQRILHQHANPYHEFKLLEEQLY